jgi:hypothetical protein
MDPATIRKLLDVAAIIIMVGVPFIVLIFPQYPPGLLSFRRRWLIAIIAGWILIVAHTLLYLRFDDFNPPNGALGVDFGALVVMILGWVPMILGSVPSLLICAIDDYRRRRGRAGLIKPFKANLSEQVSGGNGKSYP